MVQLILLFCFFLTLYFFCVHQEEHLGRGTRTNIYSGTLRVKSEEDEDAGYSSFQEVKVVLKLLSYGHRDISLVRQRPCVICKCHSIINNHIRSWLLWAIELATCFKAPVNVGRLSLKQPAWCDRCPINTLCCCTEFASTIRRVSRCWSLCIHLVWCRVWTRVWYMLVFCADIMVEEFVQLGPLDVYMRRQQSPLSIPWKFQVAKQLASALSYLVSQWNRQTRTIWMEADSDISLVNYCCRNRSVQHHLLTE